MSTCATTMQFLEPWSSPDSPFYRSDPAPGFATKNFEWQPRPVRVADARPTMSAFSLDAHAFAFRADPRGGAAAVLEAFANNDDDRVRELYYPHVERVVKEATGAAQVVVFNHVVRRRDPSVGLFGGAKGRQQPASSVHCDQSAAGAVRRVRQYAGAAADEKLKGRCAIINVWRPLVGPVKDWPLGVMDGSTLAAADVYPTDLWKGQFEPLGQTVNICQAEGQRWYYLKDHGVDEVTLIKIWDNDENVPAKLCAHCAFEDPSTPPDAPLRQSVEARCLVFY